ncbi:MAG: hypothetical protein ACE5FZ_05145 [Nitrospiria bacterium]
MQEKERRSGKQLRSGIDRRIFNDPNFNGPDRRSGLERRSGEDRRKQTRRDQRIAYVL